MFNDSDFQVFEDPTLGGRMAGIRGEIDPKFEALAPLVIETLGFQTPIFAHVAKHLRRHKNPPMNTWIAFSTNKRGYKMNPHLMIGFWDDRLFVWLASLAEAKERAQMIQRLSMMLPELAKLNDYYDISPNHMAKISHTISAKGLDQQLGHYQQVKQADFLVGRQWLRGDTIFADPKQVEQTVLTTVSDLRPFFKLLIK
ncbi:DUF1054 family protein [Lactobacillus sp. LC28-10]|uniref:DUF1054 family protein n=1 Tax=Secundilactobacillus angelensis TaxID=2722706 RepID=A0ABX1KZ63_9LACO|nr:DUF1054 family protein [Secundilactobacillus angelensis]MCH5462075.1 DUF1054 domain-containing protein [Secundilactobacillus angelensis]NLR18444.1 DUF1054 family protein [Secundilactobacillus angelensis]